MPAQEAATQNINWNNLVKAINNNECVLVLGPNIATIERDGKPVSLQLLLSEYLSQELKKNNPSVQPLEQQNLPYIAKQLEDALLPTCNFHRGRAREKLGESIQAFYKEYDFSKFKVYEEIVKLPFRFIVNTNPDHFLLDAYETLTDKFDASCVYYDYGNPNHNNNIVVEKEDIRIDAPLIFNLFGSVEDPNSLIITESDRLEFLDTILQKENTAGIPNDIAIEFTSSKDKGVEKTLVFLGFDFNKWHLRLIMHLINRYQKQKETYALQNLESLSELNSFFYKRNFDVNFIDFSPQQFAAEFLDKISNQQEVAAEESPKLNAFLVFDEKDQDVKNELDDHLAPLKRNEFIQTWDEEQIIAGSDREQEITEKLSQADIILLLVTKNFFGSDEIYKKQLQQALARHEANEAVVIPILMKSCAWQSSLIGNLNTILPRTKEAIDSNTSMLADTMNQLEGWCEKIYKRKNRK